MKVYSLTVRNRALALLLAVAVVGIGAALLVVGLALLAGLAIVGGVLGAGMLAWRRLRGRRDAVPVHTHRDPTLDPALEVFPERQVIPPPGGAPPNEPR